MTVDLSKLAIDRGGTDRQGIQARRHLLTRYVLPLALFCGIVSLLAWSSREFVFPPKDVTVVKVFSTTANIRKAGTPLFKAAGWIEPRPTPVRVAALAPGVVEELLVVEDQRVKAGDPIAQLVKDDAKLSYDRALADLELRQAELDEVHAMRIAAETRFNQPVHLQAPLAEAEALLAKIETQLKNLPFEIRRAEAEREVAQKNYERKSALKGIVSGFETDKAKSEASSANALIEELHGRSGSLEKEQLALAQRRDALKTQLELLADETKEKHEAEAKVKAAKARVAQTRVDVAEAKLQLDRMTVVSPIDGRVFRLIAHPGARLGSGMMHVGEYDGSTVVTLYRPEMLQVRVDVRFEDIPKVSFNQAVEIDNPALSAPLLGKVLFVSSEANIQKNTLQVKVEIPDPPSVFKPEMLVDVTFLAPKQPERASQSSQELKLYVALKLIHDVDGNSFVWLADQSAGVARKTMIETGAAGSNNLVEIISGLTLSSRLISEGSVGLQDGDRIKVTEESTVESPESRSGKTPLEP